MFTNLKEQVYEVKLPTHRQGHKQGEQRLSMFPLQEGHCPHGCQANLKQGDEGRNYLFYVLFCNLPKQQYIEYPKFHNKFSPIDPYHRDDHYRGEADQPGGHGN